MAVRREFRHAYSRTIARYFQGAKAWTATNVVRIYKLAWDLCGGRFVSAQCIRALLRRRPGSASMGDELLSYDKTDAFRMVDRLCSWQATRMMLCRGPCRWPRLRHDHSVRRAGAGRNPLRASMLVLMGPVSPWRHDYHTFDMAKGSPRSAQSRVFFRVAVAGPTDSPVFARPRALMHQHLHRRRPATVVTCFARRISGSSAVPLRRRCLIRVPPFWCKTAPWPPTASP